MSLMSNRANEIDITNFNIKESINECTGTTLFKVNEKGTKEDFVAKVIKCGDDEEKYDKSTQEEIKIMMDIKHPTIIKLYGYSKFDFNKDPNYTIIMELFKNG